ncbi:MAG: hypothetical protein IKE55_10545 [Kiritimatiellae bacterium]|nr:hypothetical protein [Kiritimatiellia bacterium]
MAATAMLFAVGMFYAQTATAADLTISAGETQTIGANAAYDNIYVNGTLTINSAAAVTASNVYIGHNGGTGLVTVSGGATLTASVDIFLGSRDAGTSYAEGCGRLVLLNGTATTGQSGSGCLRASKNYSAAGNSASFSTTNELWIGEGGTLNGGGIWRYGDMPLRVAFAGGIMVYNGSSPGTPFGMSENADMYFDSIDGNPIRIRITSTWPDRFTAPYYSNMPSDRPYVHFRGSGDFIQEGYRTSKSFRLDMGGNFNGARNGNLRTEDWSEFSGRIVADTRGIQLFCNGQLDSADANKPRRWVVTNGAFISVNGFNHAVRSISGDGYIDNLNDVGQNPSGTPGTIDAYVSDSQSWNLSSSLLKIRKMENGALAVKGNSPQKVDVAGGSFTLVGHEANTWQYYRFKVDKANMTAGYEWLGYAMQISEFKLFDGDTDITRSYASFTSGGTTGGGEGALMAVDGSVDTKWKLGSDSLESYDNCWIALGYSKPVRVTHYQWYTANDGCWPSSNQWWYDPTGWRLQGSMDGVAWYDLDVQADVTPNTARKALSSDISLSESGLDLSDFYASFPGNSPVAVAVGRGAAYSVSGRAAKFSSLENFGTVSYGPGVDFVCGEGDASASFVNPMYAGSGDFVKVGTGTSAVHGSSALTGAVRVEAGTLAVSGYGCPLKYWRFTVKQVETGLDGLFQLGELDLRAADGKRVNGGIAYNADVESAASLEAGKAAFVLNHGHRANDGEGIAKLFDGNVATKCCVVYSDSSYSTRITPTLSNPDSWVKIVFRLADNAKPAVGYCLVSGNDAMGRRNPNYWTLEASADGENWVTVDSRSGADTPKANSAIFNGGIPYALANYPGGAQALFPNASDVIVAPGATLAVSGGSTLSTLTIDCAGGSGTVAGFTPAAGGVLKLVNVADVAAVRELESLPITLENPSCMGAIKSWAVMVNGEPTPYRVRCSRGALTLTETGMSIIIK